LAGVGPAEVFRLAAECKPTLLILEDLNGLEAPGDDPSVFGALLGQMDGFTDLEGVGILATTNRPETFGQALHPAERPGRFHRLIEFKPPVAPLRRRIIIHLVDTSAVLEPLDDITLERLIEHTEGRTGAQIAELIRELESRTLWSLQKNRPAGVVEILENLAEETTTTAGFGFSAGLFSGGAV
jgi:ATP-dependent 26S proteasome regulatory subunit